MMAQGILESLSEVDMLRELGPAQASQFDWERIAHRLIKLLEREVEPATTQAANLADMLRQVADRLSTPPRDTVLPETAKGGVLTPVNGALGQTIGNLLDGKKSALGILGALASALFMPAETATAAGGASDPILSPLASILPTVIGKAGTGIAPVLMPISLALAAWGVVGKLDKYFRAGR